MSLVHKKIEGWYQATGLRSHWFGHETPQPQHKQRIRAIRLLHMVMNKSGSRFALQVLNSA